MDKKSRILLIALVVATIASVTMTVYQTVVKKHFVAVDFEEAEEEITE